MLGRTWLSRWRPTRSTATRVCRVRTLRSTAVTLLPPRSLQLRLRRQPRHRKSTDTRSRRHRPTRSTMVITPTVITVANTATAESRTAARQRSTNTRASRKVLRPLQAPAAAPMPPKVAALSSNKAVARLVVSFRSTHLPLLLSAGRSGSPGTAARPHTRHTSQLRVM